MNVFKTVRSWSFPPPAYSDTSQGTDVIMPPTPARPPRAMSSRSHFSAWITSFDRQWLLAHILANFSCFVTMATGIIIFVTSGLDANPVNVQDSWLASAAGMVTMMLNASAFAMVQRVSRPNHAQTLEQQSTTRFIATVVAVLLEASAATAQGAISHTTVVGAVRLPARFAV